MAMPYASLSPAVADHRSSPAAATASLLPFCRSTPLSAGGGGVAMGEDAPMTARWPPAAAARLPPFTAAQYEELEQQALIYKYLVAGVPVPPDLVLPIRRGLDSLAARFYNHPALGYGPYFGKKLDPEPGRCRRTDGKKWRCSKEAAPDSKYCERHMHRGRNRSRKPVETQLVAQSQPPSSVVGSAAAPLAAASNGSSFQNHSLYPAIAGSNGGGGGGTCPAHLARRWVLSCTWIMLPLMQLLVVEQAKISGILLMAQDLWRMSRVNSLLKLSTHLLKIHGGCCHLRTRHFPFQAILSWGH
ncbi:hypothetical protein DAI22_02g299601 [Oryza sativa Japonica Group]|nr:hypothetical protein DAI22_02g299601 [Oryza sativa Japonica Group]